jgi:midasin
MIGVQCNWPVILSGSSGVGKSSLLEGLAHTVGASIESFAVNAETDAMDLVGGYEQADLYRHTLHLLDVLIASCESRAKAALMSQDSVVYVQVVADLLKLRAAAVVDFARLGDIARYLTNNNVPSSEALLEALKQSSVAVDKAQFVWIDGILVDAMEQGKWLVLDNANLCSPSVLDRLNSLLEPNGSLIINEHVADDGSPRVIRSHPSFRIFLTVDPRYGELSRAMRNRALEIHLVEAHGSMPKPKLDPLQPESALARFRQLKVLPVVSAEQGHLADLAQDQLALTDQHLTSRFEQQLSNGLYGAPQATQALSVTQRDSTRHANRNHDELEAFYKLAVSEKQVSADFTRVQVSQASVQIGKSFTDGKCLSLDYASPQQSASRPAIYRLLFASPALSFLTGSQCRPVHSLGRGAGSTNRSCRGLQDRQVRAARFIARQSS